MIQWEYRAHTTQFDSEAQIEQKYAIWCSFPVAQMVEHGASNANIMGSIPRESKSWTNVKV